MKVLFIRSCVVEDTNHAAKGEIRDYDEKSQTHQPVLKALRAGACIAPVTKENVALCLQQLNKENAKAKARKEATTPLPKELLAAAEKLGLNEEGDSVKESAGAEAKK